MQVHFAIETTFLIVIIVLLAQKQYRASGEPRISSTSEEVDSVIKKWTPEPLVPETAKKLVNSSKTPVVVTRYGHSGRSLVVVLNFDLLFTVQAQARLLWGMIPYWTLHP